MPETKPRRKTYFLVPIVLATAALALFAFDRTSMNARIRSDEANRIASLDGMSVSPALSMSVKRALVANASKLALGSKLRYMQHRIDERNKALKDLGQRAANDTITAAALPPRTPRRPIRNPQFDFSMLQDSGPATYYLDDNASIAQVNRLKEQMNSVLSIPDNRISGLLFVANGKGKVARVRFASKVRGEDRLPSPLTRYVHEAATKLTRFAILHYGLEDNDVWYHVRTDPQSELANWTRRLTAENPNLFWVHWNPTLVDEPTGRIGTRVVPIPHFHAVQRDEHSRAPPYAQRIPGVAWRGTTTGFLRPYNMSDRWRVVKAFMGVNGSNVKFYSRCQGVTEADVPAEMMGGTLDKESSFSRYQVTIDVDGNANAWESLRWKLTTGSTVVKARSKYFIQWYYPKLISGVHLLNVDLDTQDIAAESLKLAANPELASQLGVNAAKFAEDNLRIHICAEAARRIIQDTWSYATPEGLGKDWRVQNAPL